MKKINFKIQSFPKTLFAEQFYSPNSRTRAVAAIGTESKYTVSHEVITQLEKSGKCIAITEKHYDHCMIEKMEELMINETGCTVPWVTDKNKICTDLDSSKKVYQIYTENRRNQNDICPNSCNFTDVNLSPPIVENHQDSIAGIVFYFKQDIKTSHEYYIYTELSMIAEIGGYVGLMLGISFVNIGSLINKLLDYCRE